MPRFPRILTAAAAAALGLAAVVGTGADASATPKRPPQFVVVSADGACSTDIFRRYLRMADDVGGHFTFFLSGLCLLPETHASDYRPPRHARGSSDIGFADPTLVPERIRLLSRAWRSGNEIGTHFLGHFCGSNGVGAWSTADWTSEIAQARRFLDDWDRYYPRTRLSLPFDSGVFHGDRTPCLEGNRTSMYRAFSRAGFTYEASTPGTLAWPRRSGSGLWLFPLQRIRIAGTGSWTLSMDYNFLVNQNHGSTTASPSRCARIRRQTQQSYLDALAAVHDGNRAPLFIGTHFNTWACGAYVDALEGFVRTAHERWPDVRFVSNDELVAWLDAQPPRVLRRLQQRATQSY